MIRDWTILSKPEFDLYFISSVGQEKLRIAARQRRDQETSFYRQLADLLPFEQDMTRKLNNSDIMRLVVSYIEVKNYANQCGKFSFFTFHFMGSAYFYIF